MIYSHEVEKMCTVAQGVNHGAAPIPEEAKWVKAKQIADISAAVNKYSADMKEVAANISSSAEEQMTEIERITEEMVSVTNENQNSILEAGKTSGITNHI